MPWPELQHHRHNKTPTAMPLITSITDFVKSIPTATGSSWSDLEPFANSADATIKALLVGSDLYDYIEALEDGDELKTMLCNLICFQLYKNAIPFVDLIQTNNGFAVISNSNQAPASKERVERLIAWCEKGIDETTDLMIIKLMDDEDALAEWVKFKKFNNLTNCFFYTGIDFAGYAKTNNGSRSEFLQAKSKLLTAQKNELPEVLSLSYVNELITKQRTNELDENDAYVVEVCKLALAKFYEDNEDEAEELLENLIVMIERDLDSYDTYKSSPEYALKITPKYKNKATDTTFFFGM